MRCYVPGMREPETWDNTFLEMALTIAMKSKDDSTQCGAVLVGKDRFVQATGFNGPPGCIVDECVPWTERPQKYAFIIHAEENALWRAIGSYGFDSVKGSSMYCTHAPCSECVLRMAMLGIKEAVIPDNAPPYPMSKYQVTPERVIETMAYPKLEIRKVHHV